MPSLLFAQQRGRGGGAVGEVWEYSEEEEDCRESHSEGGSNKYGWNLELGDV